MPLGKTLLVDLTYDAVRSRAASASGFVFLCLVGTYSYLYLLNFETNSGVLSFLLLLGYMAGLVLLSVPAFSLNAVPIVKKADNEKASPLRWISFLVFTAATLFACYISVVEESKNSDTRDVTRITLLVCTLLSALIFLVAMASAGLAKVNFEDERGDAYDLHVHEAFAVAPRAGVEGQRQKSAADPGPGGASLRSCFCGAPLPGTALAAMRHLSQLHGCPDTAFELYPLCTLLAGPEGVSGDLGGAWTRGRAEGGDVDDDDDDVDRRDDDGGAGAGSTTPAAAEGSGEDLSRAARLKKKLAAMPSLPPLSMNADASGDSGGTRRKRRRRQQPQQQQQQQQRRQRSASAKKGRHDPDGPAAPPVFCGALRSLFSAAGRKIRGEKREDGVFFYPALLLSTFAITVILLIVAAGLLLRFARNSREEFDRIGSRYDESVSQLRAVRAFIVILSKLQPQLAELLDVDTLLASLDKAVEVLDSTGIWIRGFVDALRRVMPAGIAIGLVVAIGSTVLMLRKFRETTFAIRAGRHAEMPGFSENAYPASKVPVFVGVSFSSALLGFVWASFLSSLILIVFVWDEPRTFIRADGRIELLVGIVILVLLKTLINKVIVNSAVTDKHTVRHPAAWGIVQFVMILVSFVTGLASAFVRFITMIALSFVYVFRLDTSIFPGKLKGFDAGYSSYLAVALMANRHTNPVMLKAAEIFHVAAREAARGPVPIDGPGAAGGTLADRAHDAEAGTAGRPAPPGLRVPKTVLVARNRWHLAYTLLKNPTLRSQRVPFSADSNDGQSPGDSGGNANPQSANKRRGGGGDNSGTQDWLM